MGVFNLIQQIVDTANSVPEEQNASDILAQRHARYHKRIVFVGSCFAVIGILLGLITAVITLSAGKTHRVAASLFVVPAMYMFLAGEHKAEQADVESPAAPALEM